MASRGKLAGKKIPVADETTSTIKPKTTSAKAKAGSTARKQSDTPTPIIKWPVERGPGIEEVVEISGRNEVGTQKLVRMNSTDRVNMGMLVLPESDTIEMNFNTVRNIVPQGTMRRDSESGVEFMPGVDPTQFWTPSRPLDTYNIPPEIRHVVDYCEFDALPSKRCSNTLASSRRSVTSPVRRYVGIQQSIQPIHSPSRIPNTFSSICMRCTCGLSSQYPAWRQGASHEGFKVQREINETVTRESILG